MSVIEQTPAAGATAQAAPRQTLGFTEAIAIVVGIVIGAGIFKAPQSPGLV